MRDIEIRNEMNTNAEKTKEHKSQAMASSISNVKDRREPTLQFQDNRPEAISQRRLIERTNKSPKVTQLRASNKMIDNRTTVTPIQLKENVHSRTSSVNDSNTAIPTVSNSNSRIQTKPKRKNSIRKSPLNSDISVSTKGTIQRQPFGLADPENIEQFADSSIGFQSTLKLQGVEETLNQAKRMIYELLRSTDPRIPLPKIVYGEIEDPLTRGHFVSKTWTITINSKVYVQNGTPIKQLPELMNTLYHEARHCEQYWHGAKRLATSMGSGNFEKLSEELNIPIRIAQSAGKYKYEGKKKASKTEVNRFKDIDKWIVQFRSVGQSAKLKSLFTGVDSEKVQVENELNASKKYLDEHKGEEKSNEYQMHKKRYEKNYTKYRTWAHEEDAWNVGMQLEISIATKQKAHIRELLQRFLKFHKETQEDSTNVSSNLLDINDLNTSRIIHEGMMMDKLEAMILEIRNTFDRINKLDGNKHASVVALLQQSADATKEGKMVAAGNLYKAAMSQMS